MKLMNLLMLIVLSIPVLFMANCNKEPNGNEPEDTGKINFSFTHYVDGQPLDTDTLKYVNASGNHYLVTEIQYFISDVTLHAHDGSKKVIDDWKDIHYVDTDLEDTWKWDVYDEIPTGLYNSISFTVGINEQKNQSLMFVDQPESLMFWPEYLGGGYHYMKLNGKWMDTEQELLPFDFHLGIGQIYDNEGNVTGFIQNYFEVTLPGSSFTINKGEVVNIPIIMNVENWFKNPHIHDHNTWGGDIMQKQEAMLLGCDNGHDVFSVGNIE